jgi:hypothetical protein
MIAISYRREDSLPIAGRLYDRLEAKFGKRNVFMDFDSIRPGLDFRQQIKETIERSDVVVAVIGPHWLGEQSDGSRRIDDPTDFVRLEIEYALKRGIPIIPMLLNNTPMPRPEKLPLDLQGLTFRHALPLDSGLDFRQHAERLIAGISDLVGITGRPNETVIASEQSQFRHSGSGASRRKFFVWSGIIFLVIVGALITWEMSNNSREGADRDSKQNTDAGFLRVHKPDDQLAAYYNGTIRVQNDSNSQPRQIAIALNSDHRSGAMTQNSKRGDFVVSFTGLWEGNELRAVTGDVISEPPGVQWMPESFTLRFTEDGKAGSYQCTADGKTYVADLVASTPPERSPTPNADRGSGSARFLD